MHVAAMSVRRRGKEKNNFQKIRGGDIMASGVRQMAEVTIEIPDKFLSVINKATLQQELKKHLAVALYAQEKISLGAAAELSGMSYYDFWQYISQFGLGLVYTAEELQEDMDTLKELKMKW